MAKWMRGRGLAAGWAGLTGRVGVACDRMGGAWGAVGVAQPWPRPQGCPPPVEDFFGIGDSSSGLLQTGEAPPTAGDLGGFGGDFGGFVGFGAFLVFLGGFLGYFWGFFVTRRLLGPSLSVRPPFWVGFAHFGGFFEDF